MQNRTPRIYLSPPCMTGAERRHVEKAFASNMIAPVGPMVDGLEADLCAFSGAKHCAALSSGTGALHLALLILGVQPGDDVICASFTFAASANPIVYVGATPVFVDSEPETWNMDPALLEEAIEDRHRKTGRYPGAIVLVHLYGMPAKLDELMAVAARYDIPVVEDAAEALGSGYRGAQRNHEQHEEHEGGRPDRKPSIAPREPRTTDDGPRTTDHQPLGTFGAMGIYSFNGNKIITTSGGGALLSDNAAYVRTARFLATQARDDAPHYEHSRIGYNYRMSNILAAIGRGQMEALPSFVQKRREINRRYRKRLSPMQAISFLTEPDERYRSNFWLTTILIDSNAAGTDRETIRHALEAENIESRPLWKPMHMQPVYKQMNAPMYGGAVCERLFSDGLCLPSGTAMTDADLDRVCAILTTTGPADASARGPAVTRPPLSSSARVHRKRPKNGGAGG